MPLIVNQASDHTSPRSLQPYCSPQDVLARLIQVVPDDARNALEATFTEAEKSKVLALYLGDSKLDYNLRAKRDLDLHQNVDIIADGSGGQVLNLGQAGFWPIVQINSFSVSGSTIDTGKLMWTQEGLVMREDGGGFPMARMNIKANITWGWNSPPELARVGQACFATARVLRHIARANSGDPGMIGGIEVMNYGPLSVRQYQQGRFAPDIKSAIEDGQIFADPFHKPSVVSLRPNTQGSNEYDLSAIFGAMGYAAYRLSVVEHGGGFTALGGGW